MLVYVGFSTFELMQAPGSTVLYTELCIAALHSFLRNAAFSRSVHMVETSVQAQLRPLGWLWMLGLMLFWEIPPAAKKAVFSKGYGRELPWQKGIMLCGKMSPWAKYQSISSMDCRLFKLRCDDMQLKHVKTHTQWSGLS